MGRDGASPQGYYEIYSDDRKDFGLEEYGQALTCVIDSSVVIEYLIATGPASQWAGDLIRAEELVAPHIMPAEAANLLRRATLYREIDEAHAAQAHNELLSLKVNLLPYFPYGPRAWQLKGNVTVYDAWYVALAEDLGLRLATLDGNLIRSPGPRCEFVTFQQ
jgi:predicted nucleic acid-binding protein